MKTKPKITELLEIALAEKASDLHIVSGQPPVLRINGKLSHLKEIGNLSEGVVGEMVFEMMGEERKKEFLKQKDIDFSYNFVDKVRCRVNVFFQKERIACALRVINSTVPNIDDLGLPLVLHDFIDRTQGLILVTGPSGQGKSTTLASLIDEINRTRAENIITIEDPIEYVFQPDRSIISQREVRQDTASFSRALKATFRQDPDIIMVGEMRDPETIATTITAAETGHLVFATLHTNSAYQSIHRMVDSFAAGQQNQIRSQLSASLAGIVSQRLVPAIHGGLTPACEIMINNAATGNLIRESKIHEIPVVIETSAEKGMISLNKSLGNLVREKKISLETAQRYSLHPEELKNLINR